MIFRRLIHTTHRVCKEHSRVHISDVIGTHTLSRLRALGVNLGPESRLSLEAVKSKYPLQEPVQDMTVNLMSSNGLGICEKDGWLFVAPLVLPNEQVTLKPYKHMKEGISLCDLVEVNVASKDRIKPKCEYFRECSACSFQHWNYEKQLEHKRSLIVHSFRNLIPEDLILPFQESPQEFGVRTKLTPHNPKVRKNMPLDAIGFLKRGANKSVVDIPNCIVATDSVNEGLRKVRSLAWGSKSPLDRLGTTYMIRHSLTTHASTRTKTPLPPFTAPAPNPSRTMKLEDFIKKIKQDPAQVSAPSSEKNLINSALPSTPSKPLSQQLNLTPTSVAQPYPPPHLHSTSITNTNSTILDVVNGYVFRTPSNSFFQNNSHILPHLITYISNQLTTVLPENYKTNTLIDAYCGSGLFAITQSRHFKNVIGIEMEPTSIGWARQNAADNLVQNTRFIGGDVKDVFSGVEAMVQQMSPPPPSAAASSSSTNGRSSIGDDCSLIVDPPKKGCGKEFLNQVMRLNPRVIIYVSCNPDSAVRDLEILKTIGEEGVAPQSYKGSVGGLVKGQDELGKISKSLESSRVLYLGGKRIVRGGNGKDEGGQVQVQELDVVDGFLKQESPSLKVKGTGELEPITLLKVKGYKVVRVKPFDMFPQSPRSEAVITLVRQDCATELNL